MTHEEVADLLPAYALDALTPDEVWAVESHLPTCAKCQADLHALRQVAADLGTAVPAVAPPAALRRQVMAALRPPARTVAVSPRWGLRVGAAAAALVVVLAIGGSITLNRRLAVLQQQLTTQEQALVLLTNPAARTTVLTGSLPGNVRLVYDPGQRRGALVVSDLRDPGANLIYQVWLIAGQQPESAGLFRPAPGGPVIVPLAADFLRYQLVAISVEPAPRGSLQPTTTPILSGKI